MGNGSYSRVFDGREGCTVREFPDHTIISNSDFPNQPSSKQGFTRDKKRERKRRMVKIYAFFFNGRR
jgi:hypothetical protein